jgi:Lrp/AsnC family leucine-responsive transcriptional regulator
MEKLDLKDKKLLYQLNINSRQSYSQIARKVGLSKNVLVYRINRLKEKEIIKSYYTVIDAYKLGYIGTRFHFVFQYTTPEIKKEIIYYFIKNQHTALVASVQGYFDLSVLMWVRNVNDFYQCWQNMQNKYGYYFQEQTFTFFLKEKHFRPSYLLLDQYNSSDRLITEETGGGKPVDYDDFDFNILKLISSKARMPLIEIAEKLNSSVPKIKNRIKNLIKKDIIKGFRAEINLIKIGYNSFKVYIFLKEFKLRNQIINYIKMNPYLTCIDTTTGESHLELEFHLKTLGQLHEIMRDLINYFPKAVRNYRYVSVIKMHKFLFMPES